MSYEPTNWVSGDTITAARLNKMEQGIADSGSDGGWDIIIKSVGNVSSGTYTLLTEKSAADLYDALLDDNPVTAIVYEVVGSGVYYTCTPFVCNVFTTSVPDAVYIGNSAWGDTHYFRYQNNSISWV